MSTNSWYKTTGSPPFINQRLDIETWTRYVQDYDFGRVAPNKIVLHHTWSPNQDTWNGLTSMKGMQKYYHTSAPGAPWPSGPHIFNAFDGIWLGTPMQDIGTHARACNATHNAQGRLIGYSIGVEMVWDGSRSQPSGPTWDNTLAVLGELCIRMNQPPRTCITFHRNCGKPACPGEFVKDEWVWTQVERWLGNVQGTCLAAYYAQEGAVIHTGPSADFTIVRPLTLGDQILSDASVDGWAHMARFPPLQYDEGFISKDKLRRAF